MTKTKTETKIKIKMTNAQQMKQTKQTTIKMFKKIC